jgi:hypothetical protein
MSKLYVELFHGRTKPREHMDEWGYDGPIIEGVNAGMTYGQFKIFDEDGDTVHLPMSKDLIHLKLDGKHEYYGDLAIIPHDADNIEDWLRNNRERILTFDEFKQKYKITF